MPEKKRVPFGRWILSAVLFYLAYVSVVIAKLAIGMSNIWVFSATFLSISLLIAPGIIKIDKMIKVAIGLTISIVVISIYAAMSVVSLGSSFGCFISIIFIGLIAFRLIAFVVVAFVLGLIFFIGLLSGPGYGDWYYWWW